MRQTFVEQGLDAALNPKPSSQLRLLKLDGVAEARLIACCCSQPPPGRKEWTLRLLASEMVKLDYVDSIYLFASGEILLISALEWLASHPSIVLLHR